METKEKVNINVTNYNEFWNLLNSKDKDNAIVAMSILEQSDLRDSLPYILLLFKNHSASKRAEWLKESPILSEKLKTLGVVKDTDLTYKWIIDMIINKCTNEGIQFIIDKFTIVLHKYTIEWGFDFMKDIDMKLTLKKDDKE